MKRGRIELIAAVLHAVRNSEERTFSGKEPMPMSRLAASSWMNQTVFISIAETLTEQKLVEVIPRNKTKSTYRLTIEGRDWIKQFDALMNILELPLPRMPS